MILNPAGQMVKKWYYELENKFPDKKCHEMAIMPNHFHFIIETVAPVGVDLCVDPNRVDPNRVDPNRVVPNRVDPNRVDPNHIIEGEHMGSPLRAVLQWLKTMSTNEYIRNVKNNNWPRFDGKLWQRNYWEHIVRNENEFNRIAQYIVNNPSKWDADNLNKRKLKQGTLREEQQPFNEEPWMV